MEIRIAINMNKQTRESPGTLFTVGCSELPPPNLPFVRSLKKRLMVPIQGNSDRAFPDIHSSLTG